MTLADYNLLDSRLDLQKKIRARFYSTLEQDHFDLILELANSADGAGCVDYFARDIEPAFRAWLERTNLETDYSYRNALADAKRELTAATEPQRV